MKNRGPFALFGGLFLALLTACGGGSMTGTPSPSSPTITSIVPACSPLTIAPGGTAQCSATVHGTGTYSSADTWTVSAGSISASGLYTAPNVAENVTVTATSLEDPTKTGSTTIAVQAAAPTIASVTVTCTPATLAAGATSQCTANVQGTGAYSPAVSWTASGGSITANGLLTAPASAGAITVTATSTQDATRTGTAQVTVQAAPSTITAVSVSCNPAIIPSNGTAQCTAAVQGTGNYNPAVTWTASGGVISSTGLLAGPATAGNVTVTATSTQDTRQSGNALVVVQAAASTVTAVSVACNPSTVATSGTSQCSAAVQGTGSYSSSVTWTASAGTITAGGVLTAPATAASVTVTATSTQNTARSGQSVVTVQAQSPAITSVSVACNPSTVAANATSQCSATVQGTGSFSSAVTWGASTGTIDAGGLFTAPASAGSATVTATSTQDSSKTGTANITVQLQTPVSKHVVIVMEENQSYNTVVGQTSWPNLNQLISNGALATNYYGDSHPSIGNYFMLTTGQLLTTNDNSTAVWNVDNVARRMLASGVTFKVYAEGITQGYLGNNTGSYLVRHNPFAKLSDVADSTQVANATIWPFSQFATDLANGTLPEFSFVVPDVNDDAHDGTPQQADTWLQTNLVTPLSNLSAFQPGGDGLLIVDFDEAADSDTAHGGGHIPAVFWGPNVQVGFKQASGTVYQHESLLRTMMEALGLSNPPGAAATAPAMSEFFVQK